MSEAPSAENIRSTSVTLKWKAWNPENGDIGDGPIVSYNVYEFNSSTNPIESVTASQKQTPIISVQVNDLIPETEYVFYVRVEREGSGGEGPRSENVTVITLMDGQTQVTKPTATPGKQANMEATSTKTLALSMLTLLSTEP